MLKSEKKEKTYLLKNLEISWLLTKNLKGSYYHISADSFIKNNIAYDFRVEISFCLNRKFFDFKKTSFRYNGFSAATNVFL